MKPCGAVYVELGEQPELDRLIRCVVRDCADHTIQLDWVRADSERLAAYNEQVRRYDLGAHLADLAEQGALL
jgi:hypothetical protein